MCHLEDNVGPEGVGKVAREGASAYEEEGEVGDFFAYEGTIWGGAGFGVKYALLGSRKHFGSGL
jgi:hypothetical protein